MDEAKNQINDLEHKEAKNNHADEQEEKLIQTNEESVNNFRRSNIRIIGVLEEEKKDQEIGNLCEKNSEKKFPNLVKEIDMQVQEAQRVPVTMDAKRPTPKHIIIKRSKFTDKERLLKAREKKLVTGRLPDRRREEENG